MDPIVLIRLFRFIVLAFMWMLVWQLVVIAGVNHDQSLLIMAVICAGLLCMRIAPPFPYVKQETNPEDEDQEEDQEEK